MAKQSKAPAQVEAVTVEGKKSQSKPAVLEVKSGLQFRGARKAWYEVLLQHNGKPADAYLSACAANPPHLTKKGTAENPSGWLRYFLRTGAASLK